MAGKKTKDYSKAQIPGVIPLNFKARQEVLAVWMSLGADATYSDVSKVTGYSTWAITDYLGRYKHDNRYKQQADNDKPGPNPKPKSKPVFIAEVEKTTGLKCQLVRKTELDSEWLLLSPTKVPILKLFGSTDVVSGVQAVPRTVVQGISKLEREKRLQAKRARREPLPPELPKIEENDNVSRDEE